MSHELRVRQTDRRGIFVGDCLCMLTTPAGAEKSESWTGGMSFIERNYAQHSGGVPPTTAEMIRQKPGQSRTRADFRVTLGTETTVAALPLRIMASVSTRFDGWLFNVTGARGGAYVLAVERNGFAGRLFSPDGRQRWDVDSIRFVSGARS